MIGRKARSRSSIRILVTPAGGAPSHRRLFNYFGLIQNPFPRQRGKRRRRCGTALLPCQRRCVDSLAVFGGEGHEISETKSVRATGRPGGRAGQLRCPDQTTPGVRNLRTGARTRSDVGGNSDAGSRGWNFTRMKLPPRIRPVAGCGGVPACRPTPPPGDCNKSMGCVRPARRP